MTPPTAIPSVTLKEVNAGILACVRATSARHAAERAESDKSSAMMAVLEPLLGIKTSEELAALTPGQLAARAKRRIRNGDVRLDGIDEETLLQVIQKSQSRRNVKWKEEFEQAVGASKATEIVNATAETYSYKFVQP